MKNIIKVLISLVLVGAIAYIGFNIATGGSPITSFSEDIKTAAANAFIDAGGYKQKAAQALKDNREKIAAATGLSLEEVDVAIDNLDIENWKATTLPKDAVSTDSFNANYDGVTGTVTTYEDPSYVTINAAGQAVTMEVPESAQDYLSYLAYL